MNDSLYKSLVKTPLSLQQRSLFADTVAAHSRLNNPDLWNTISAFSSKFSAPLRKLESSGFLQLSNPSSSSLINQLISISPHKFFDANYVPLTESFHLQGIKELSSVKRLLNDVKLHTLISLYLNAPARISDCIAWWHFPMPCSSSASNAQKWHRDRDDFAELKLFMYATDVDLGSGPHAFIPGSHEYSNLAQLFPNASKDDPVISARQHSFLTNQQLSQYGLLKSNVKPWLGPKGLTFLEDTRGLHRAFPPINKPRLMFSIVWTVASGIIPDIY